MQVSRKILLAIVVTLLAAGCVEPPASPTTIDEVVGALSVNGMQFARVYDTYSQPTTAITSESWGVLELSLRPGGYAWTWRPVEPVGFQDAGRGQCAGDNQSSNLQGSVP